MQENLTKWCGAAAFGAAAFLGANRADAIILPGSFWPNGNLETASAEPGRTRFDSPALTATTSWRRGGGDFSDPPYPGGVGPFTFDFWDNAAGTVSGTHALRVSDNSPSGNGEWFVPAFSAVGPGYPDINSVPIPAGPGNFLQIHFYWNYSTAIDPIQFPNDGADMRVTVRGYDGISDFGLGPAYDFLANGSTGGAFVEVDFVRPIPPGMTGMQINIASGGSGGVTGFLAVDDISVLRVIPEPASAIAAFGAAGLLIRRRRA
jgi:hypothetical protein